MKSKILKSVAGFCEEYGFSRVTLYKMIKCRRIPVIRTGEKGHAILLDPVKVLAALEQPAATIGTDKSVA